MRYIEERKIVLAAVREIYEAGLVSGTWGNVSARCPGTNLMIITPSGMNYDTLTIGDMVLAEDSGRVLEGNLKPSVETSMHGGIYKNRPDVQAVVHTHSLYAAAFGVAGKNLPVILEETATTIGHAVPLAEYAPAGTSALAQNVVETLGQDKQAAFLPHHGLVTVGPSMEEALKKAYVIERSCRVCIYAQILGKVNSLPEKEINAVRENFKHYGQSK